MKLVKFQWVKKTRCDGLFNVYCTNLHFVSLDKFLHIWVMWEDGRIVT